MKRLICLGDSITDSDRLFSSNGLGHGYVNQLNTLLNGNTNTFEIVNRGVNGFTVSRLLEHVGRDCIDRHPDIVTILIGINDVGLMMNTNRTPSQQKEMLANFGRYYRQLLATIRQHTNCTILLMEPFIFPYPREYWNWIPFVKHLSGQIGDLATEYRCPYLLLHDRLNQATESDGYASITPDGIHLTENGHKIIADQLYPYLASI